MSRENLYRGKRLDNGEWVYGCFICPEFDESRAYIGYLFSTDDHDLDVVEVEYETVGQYIGWTDKNGTKIFDGDIVYSHYKNDQFLGYVDFIAGTYVIISPHQGTVKDLIDYEVDVIGNIHDNLELLNSI